MTDPAPIRVATIYPQDVIAANGMRMDVIAVDGSQVDERAVDGRPRIRTLPQLFAERVARSPEQTAYIQYDGQHDGATPGGRWVEYSWQQVAAQVARWSRAIESEGFAAGERAALRMRNRWEWVVYDQACLAAGLVVVPLYFEDRADNIAYILEQTEARLLLVETAEMWQQMADELPRLTSLQRVVVLEGDAGSGTNLSDDSLSDDPRGDNPRVLSLSHWLNAAATADPKLTLKPTAVIQGDDLATIVYTSGTTGKPKGVMLSHTNILTNAHAGLKSVPVFPSDRFLSFLPLSHMFERTVGYYLPMMAAASVAFNRGIPVLLDDLAATRPTIMITVPRIFERAYAAIQTQLEQGAGFRTYFRKWLFAKAVAVGWRRFEASQGRAPSMGRVDKIRWKILRALVAKKIQKRFGGRLRYVVSGGAPLAPNISRVFIALGIEILQGYGLTETSPTLTVNTLTKNKPASIGLPYIGTEIRLAEGGELQARGASVMLGYWRNEQATRECIDPQGWLSTGDLAAIDPEGFIAITGRIKEIIVLDTGEKVPPADMEAAICDDPLFEQAMVIGEGRPFLMALLVLSETHWSDYAQNYAQERGLDPNDESLLATEQVERAILERIQSQLHDFPGYAVIRRVCLTTTPWSVQDGTLTPTLKIKRPVLRERFAAQIADRYRPNAPEPNSHQKGT